MSNSAHLMIGEVAARAGVAPSAIRYYERAGLLQPQSRVGGRRIYDDGVLETLSLIGLAQDAGFTIAETKVLLHGFERATPASQRWRTLAQRKLKEIRERVERAERMRGLLERLLQCECETLGQCVRSRRAALALATTVETPAQRRLPATPPRRSTS